MAYIRISISTPKEGSRDRVLELEDRLLASFKDHDGFRSAYRLTSSTQVGRVSIWDAEANADAAANSQHTLSLRSELMPLLAHSQEMAFDGDEIKSNQPAS